MKIKIASSLTTALGCLALLAFAPESRAGNAQAQSFNTTNQLVNGANYTSYPTNGAAIATGGPINIDNYNTIGLYFDGDVTNNASAVVGLTLVRSHKTPTAYFASATSTNNGNGTTNWETTAVYKVAITVPAMTNHFTYLTNLPNDFAGCARDVGLSAITNNLASGQQVNNLDIGVVKRIVPIVYP